MILPGLSFVRSIFRKPAGRALIESLKRIRSWIESLLGLLADFFAEDLCLICGVSHDCSEPPHDDGREGGEEDAEHLDTLTEPVTVTVCGPRFRNHPICSLCARDFQTARTVGVLGAVVPGGGVVTVAGDIFGAETEDLQSASGLHVEAGRLIQVIAPFMTNDTVLQIVHLAKYKGVSSLLEIMARTITQAVERFGVEFPVNSILVPVSLFVGDPRQIDHTNRISASLASALSLPLGPGRLQKIRVTGSQSRTPRKRRAQNVRNAFVAAGFQDLHVLLVDDIVTSGATAGACSASLAAAGAQSVTLLCFGRAL